MSSETNIDLLQIRQAVEAVLMVSSDPVSEMVIAQVVEVTTDTVSQICSDLAEEYEENKYGFELVKVAGGWRYQTRSHLSDYLERYALEGVSTKISSAALETLSIVAYKQPISRAQISAIRGVNADGVLKTLHRLGYVEEIGIDEGPGQAILFGTSSFFLEQIGLDSINDLPALGEFVPSAQVLEALENSLKISDDDSLDNSDSDLQKDDVIIDLTEPGPGQVEMIDLSDLTG